MKHIVDAIKKRKEEGGTVFICGNGGSGATAEHFANDLFSKGVRAVCLNSNTAIMTMRANDYRYEQVFSQQLEIFADPGDLLIVISASGKSPNIQRALSEAKYRGLEAMSLFGLQGEPAQTSENRHLYLAHLISNQL